MKKLLLMLSIVGALCAKKEVTPPSDDYEGIIDGRSDFQKNVDYLLSKESDDTARKEALENLKRLIGLKIDGKQKMAEEYQKKTAQHHFYYWHVPESKKELKIEMQYVNEKLKAYTKNK